MKKLVGCINHIKAFGLIKTRFFYVNSDTEEIKDVTLELCQAIESFNDNSKKIRKSGDYALIIPYEYKDGMAVYSHGCGLSHYLQEEKFKEIESIYIGLSFPLSKCKIEMYTKNDVRHILGCKSVFDRNIVNH